MKCIKCGMDLKEGDIFCANCGTPVPKNNNEVQSENMQMNYNYQPNNQNYGQAYKKNSNSSDIIKICSATIIIVAIIAAVAFVIVSIFSKKDEKNNYGEQPINNTENFANYNNSGNTSEESGNSGNINEKDSSYKVNFKGFKLYIPDNLIYQVDSTNNLIAVGDSLQTWIANLDIQQAPFEKVKQKRNSLSSVITQSLSAYNGYASEATLETVDGVEYIILEASAAGENALMCYAGLNSMYTACIEVYNENNDFSRDTLKNISKIIKNAEYVGESSYLKNSQNIKLEDAIKALDKID